MALSFVFIGLVALVAYFHYVQGFLSSALSMIAAILSAMIAFSIHEPLVGMISGGKLADIAHGGVLIASFALVYLIIRTIVDKVLPGNIRYPLMVDRIGAVACGIVAGIFAIGTFATGMQMLPFGVSILGHARTGTVANREVQLPTAGQSRDLFVNDELSEKLEPNSLLMPVDEWVVSMVGRMSRTGSLSGKQPMDAVHPNYLDEIFFGRAGIQAGAKIVATNKEGKEQVRCTAVYLIDSAVQAEAQLESLRPPKASGIRAPKAGHVFVVCRTMFELDASDDDRMVRFSTGAVRLYASGNNYWPLGTLQNNVLMVNRRDDFLFVNVADKARGADFVFEVKRDDMLTGAAAAPNPPNPKNKPAAAELAKIKPGVFLEVKRSARIPLGDKDIQPVPESSADIDIFRPKGLVIPGTAIGEPGASAQPAAIDRNPSLLSAPMIDAKDLPFEMDGIKVSSTLPFPIATLGYDDAGNATLVAGKGFLKDGKFVHFSIQPPQDFTKATKFEGVTTECWVPDGNKLVQVNGTASTQRDADHWAWAKRINQFSLVNTQGTRFKPHGAFARIKNRQQDLLLAVYDSIHELEPIETSEGRPTDIWLAFSIPVQTQLAAFMFQDGRIRNVSLAVR